jgi:hypothetical protein
MSPFFITATVCAAAALLAGPLLSLFTPRDDDRR